MRLEFEVRRAGGPALIQDLGRPGHLGEGVPTGGALIPDLLAASNRALGNPAGAAALEVYADLDLVAREEGTIAIDGMVLEVTAGEVIGIERPTRNRARYLALAGGIDVPPQLGSRGTLDMVGLGGFEGRALRRGDVLRASAVTGAPLRDGAAPTWDGSQKVLRVVPGPDVARFGAEALSLLTAATFVVSPSSNRVGTRLLGAPLPRLDSDGGLSAPMVAGALQVPASGEPIVLGPDHPTLGGYPVIAVLICADHGALFSRRPGAAVRFETIDANAARAATAAWRAHLLG